MKNHENLFQTIFVSPSNIDSECISLLHLLFRHIGYCLGIIIGFPMFFSLNQIFNQVKQYIFDVAWLYDPLPTESESLPEMKSTAIKINNIGWMKLLSFSRLLPSYQFRKVIRFSHKRAFDMTEWVRLNMFKFCNPLSFGILNSLYDLYFIRL